MAFTTQADFYSASALMPPFGVGVLPSSPATQAQQQQSGWGFSGVVTGAPVVIAGIIDLTLNTRDISWTLNTRSVAWTLNSRED